MIACVASHEVGNAGATTGSRHGPRGCFTSRSRLGLSLERCGTRSPRRRIERAMAATPNPTYMTEGEAGLSLALLVGAFLCALASAHPVDTPALIWPSSRYSVFGLG